MRDFARTPEPSGDAQPPAAEIPRFVIQEHHATALHWDLRLERDGVLASWAVPKGIPPDPRVDHLAVQTEDHPMLYLEFSGSIPEGEYGGGLLRIWDRGTYRCEKWSEREVMITLEGERARGRYVLFHTGARNWMLHRMDPPADPSRELLPASFALVDEVDGGLPEDQSAWSFEAALGGRRVVVVSQGGRARVEDGAGHEVSDRWPEARSIGPALGTLEVALEAEIVVAGGDGRPDGALLARREAATAESAARRLASRHPAGVILLDLLWLEGHATSPLPFGQRRALLEKVVPAGGAWQVAPAHPGEGAALLAAAEAQALPGVRARRLDTGYQAGALRFTAAGATGPTTGGPRA
jgi:bifunctional non-homologous end joining protein LigD